jgi:four helix bundle protein
MINSCKDLIVWQKSAELSVFVYDLTKRFPKEELFGLSSQMRRSAVSIASNIAEGRYRGTRKDFVQFLRIAFGSGAELETQIFIAKQIYSGQNFDYIKIESLLTEVMKMLNAMIKSINPKS